MAIKSYNNAVGVVSVLQFGQPKNHGSLPDREKIFFPKTFRPSLGLTLPPIRLISAALSLGGREDRGIKQPDGMSTTSKCQN
jgi:hypothetical protein